MNWTVRTLTKDAPTAGRPGTVARFHDIEAADGDRQTLNERFWALFPRAEEAFIRLLRGDGIHAWVPFDFQPSVEHGEAPQQWEAEYTEALERLEERLPDPPFGCEWRGDTGGPIVGRDAGGRMVPVEMGYRLWRRDLGYMLGSE